MADSGKKRKNYYSFRNTKRPKTTVEPGLKGFLCSCNGHEKECVHESYNILNKFADVLYKPSEEKEQSNTQDIEDDLSSEIQDLKKEFKFNLMDSGAKNLLFIRTSIESPIELATSIVKDVQENSNPQTRYLVRLVPIQQTCKAYMEDINACAKELLECNLPPNKSFAIMYNHRNNNNLKRDEVIKEVANIAHNLGGDNKVNLSSPDICIIIEVIKNIVFMSVIPDYIKYKKFNLLIGTQDEKCSSDKEISPSKAEVRNSDCIEGEGEEESSK